MPLPTMDFTVIEQLPICQQADLKHQFKQFRAYRGGDDKGVFRKEYSSTAQKKGVDGGDLEEGGCKCCREHTH